MGYQLVTENTVKMRVKTAYYTNEILLNNN